jgi:periplasmic divalent cation tolerance protein
VTEIVTVYATFPSADEADRIGMQLVAERLAACVNILGPCRSIYRWRGRIERSEEVGALFKTRAETADRLIGRLAGLHAYDVPAAVAWPIANALSAYAQWVVEETEGREA